MMSVERLSIIKKVNRHKNDLRRPAILVIDQLSSKIYRNDGKHDLIPAPSIMFLGGLLAKTKQKILGDFPLDSEVLIGFIKRKSHFETTLYYKSKI